MRARDSILHCSLQAWSKIVGNERMQVIAKELGMTDIIGLAYAGLIITGGLVGYFKAGSTVSLAAGLAFGVAAGFAVYFNNNVMLLVVSSGLALVMGIRFIHSGKVIPSGVVAVLSLFMVMRCLWHHFH